MSSQPATTSAKSPATTDKPVQKYYMDPKLVRKRVGTMVKPTNPLLQFIPECKNIDEFNEFTKTETYRKLMDFRNPIIEPKMDASLRPAYEKTQAMRVRLMEIKDYPLYAKLPVQRFWYRASWAFTIIGSVYAIQNVLYVVYNN